MALTSPQPNVGSTSPADRFGWRFWLAAALTGAGTGVCGGLLMKLLRAVQHLFWTYNSGDFVSAVAAVSWPHRVCVVLLAGLMVPVVRWRLNQAHGAHGGELTAAIWFHAGRLAPVPAITNAVSSIIEVGLGSALGRESAPKQLGALMASLLSDWNRLPAGQRRLLAACGGGAGMAAVYNVPLGGALFSLEVLLGTLSLRLIGPALATSVLATAVSWALLPNEPTYSMPAYQVTASQTVWAAFAGPLFGLAAIAFVRMIVWSDEHKPKGNLSFIVPLAVFGALGCLAVPFPQLLGNGKDVVQAALLDRYALPLLLVLAVLRPIMTGACLGSGAPGGLFTPTMAFGAVLGAALGHAWAAIWPGAPIGEAALLGSVAVLAATTQGPISAIVMVIELTGHFDSTMVPIMVAVGGAVFVTRRFENRSVYSGRIHTARLRAEAADAAEQPDVEVISAAARYPELLTALLAQTSAGSTVRVVDENGTCLGDVCRDWAVQPAPALGPLEIAAAGDFVPPA